MRWFHSGGIFASLCQTRLGELILEAMQAAKAAGAVVSFDLNYREKLWKPWGGDNEVRSVYERIVDNVDVLVGNEEDLQKALGVPGPEIGRPSGLDPEAFAAMIEGLLARFPAIKVGGDDAARRRLEQPAHVGAPSPRSTVSSMSPRSVELEVLDRVGGGDGFASGLFYGFLAGEGPQQSVDLGWAHGALLATFPGDTTMATLRQVRELAEGGSARVQR